MSTDHTLRYKRIVVKVTGRALAAMNPTPFDSRALELFVREIMRIHAAGVQVAVLADSSNLLGHRRPLNERWYVAPHNAGRLVSAATLFNAVLLRSAFLACGKEAVGLPISEMTEADSLLSRGVIVTLFHADNESSNHAAARAAVELIADALLLAEDLGDDSLVWPSPMETPDVHRLATISFECALEHFLRPIDADTAALAHKNDLSIHLLSVRQPNALERATKAEDIGTVICRDGDTFDTISARADAMKPAAKSEAEAAAPSPYDSVANPHHLDLNDSGIRDQIDNWIQLGYNPADFFITREGQVLFDYEAATERRMGEIRDREDQSE